MKTAIAAVLTLGFLLSVPHASRGDDDHERARRAVQAGEVLPLRTILDRVARDFPGDVIETELDDEDGEFVYEVKLISPEGRVMKVYCDARDGRVIKVKGKRP